ncbi:gamma-glutamylcyclotransferase [Cohaesibacter sp. CAU 1516]|uniref:gamma-glutamylcyclotransferase family protein n=1 Tax=Cohaesibacter sp. CAU 1516 TaxID=2576038 RepID=UPI0010FD5306|nr:gamma-glutamylcyclotransferase family protein [Cohaesibacter sp. CAU 1516]TLP43371.1 gamma-glutamylcyclotransferase [Cohaesibacter sp. CAU 1516]
MTLEQVREKPQEWVGYFGYGSLVNDDTRNAESFGFAGRLKGYRRRWSIWSASAERRAFGFGGVAALSVTANAQSLCDGLLIFDRKDHLPKVDEREAMYDRVKLDLCNFSSKENLPAGIDCYIYVGHTPHTEVADPDYPILQSYVDAVMQGFLHKFGEEGVARFVAETDGWQTPIVQDRDRPFYPRSVTLSLEEEELIDHYVKLSGAPLVSLP